MTKNLYIVLMAGGIGSRFWPYSRDAKPKQFLDVLGTGKTLLQSAFHRVEGLCSAENIYVVTHASHIDIAAEQLPSLRREQIVGEPERRNTAPCILYVAHKIRKKNPNAVMLVCPSDHIILDEIIFREKALALSVAAASQDKLITLGIKPTRAETGYGYIQYLSDESELKKVKTFTEKPEKTLAKKFVESGDFLWNAGIFIWGVQAILQAFARHMPDMSEIFDEIKSSFNTDKEPQAISLAYAQMRSISIDYAILEKADNVYVLPCAIAWSDLGSWQSAYEESPKDEQKNTVKADALLYDVKECIVRAPEGKLVVAEGLSGYLVGAFDNVFIVCKKDKEEFFRNVVNELKSRQKMKDYL